MTSRKADWLDLSPSLGIPLMDKSLFGVLIEDQSGHITYINPALRALLGYSEAELQAAPFSWQRTPPEFESRDVSARAELDRTGSCTPYETVYIAKDGRHVPVLLSATVLERSLEGGLLIATFVADRAALQHSEWARHENDALLETLFTSAPIGMSLVDLDLRYVRVNEHLAAMNQLPIAAHLGRTASELSPHTGHVAEAYWRHVIATGAPLTGVEISDIVGGRDRHVLVSYYPVRADDGQIVGVGGLMVNITERKRAERTSALLDTVSSVLAAALNERSMLAAVTRRLVPTFADGCVTWLADDDGALICVEIAHVLPEKATLLRALYTRYPPDLAAPNGVAQTLRTGVSSFAPLSANDVNTPSGESEAFHTLVAAIAPRSLLTVALRARNLVLGAKQFFITESERRFSADDLSFAEEIAQRCALAIDNTRLYQAEERARRMIEHVAERITRLQTVTAALTEAITGEQVGRVLVDHCIATFGAYAGAFMIREDDDDVLHLMYQAGYRSELTASYARLPLATRLPLTDAVRSGALVVVDSRAALETYVAHDDERPFNPPTDAVIALPLLKEDRAVAGIVLSFEFAPTLDADDRVLLLTIARLGTQALERAHLYDMEQRARQIAEHAMMRISRLQTLTAALVNAVTREAVVDTIMGVGRLAVGAEAGGVMLITEDGAEFVLAGAVGLAASVLTQWRRFALVGASPFAEAAQSLLPVFISSITEWQRRYPGQALPFAERDDQAFVALPLIVDSRVIGAIGFTFWHAQTFSLEDRALMVTFAQQCAQSLERARLYETEQQARKRQAFLADASRVLAESLNYTETLQTIAQMAVPTIADFCTIHLIEADGTICQLAVVHRDPAMIAHLEELERRYPMQPDDPYGLPAVIRSRAPLLMSNLPDTMLHDFAQTDADDDRLRLLQALQLQSYLCLPLIARDRTLGALSLFTVGVSARRYGVDDLRLAEDLAQRCAQAMDNARLYHDAHEAVRTRDTFLSIAAHELKTPLTSLLGNVQLLQRRMMREGMLNERNQHSIQVTLDQARRLNKLIADLLDLSRIELGQLSLACETVDLGALTQRIIDEVRPTFAEHDLLLAIADAPLLVAGDTLRLEQVIQNLISNGVKYSPHGGEVRVQLSQRGDSACIAISDQGIGIPADAIPKLFQRFYRASNVRADQISGVGVGLFVVKEIVTLHGGTIEVESVEGAGSTFSVLLPLANNDPKDDT